MSVRACRIAALSCAKCRASGEGRTATPRSSTCSQNLPRDVLVIERHNVAAAGEGQHGRRIVVRTDDGVGHHLRGTVGRACRKHPEPYPEGDRGLVSHPRQLTATDHSDDRIARRGTLLTPQGYGGRGTPGDERHTTEHNSDV